MLKRNYFLFRWALLNISDVDIWDDGRYDFFCPGPGGDKISFCLKVEDVPRAVINVTGHHYDLFNVGDEYEERTDSNLRSSNE
jgi:hypothetical protein